MDHVDTLITDNQYQFLIFLFTIYPYNQVRIEILFSLVLMFP